MNPKLDRILQLPFAQYIQECWAHAHERAQVDPLCSIVYGYMRQTPAEAEANWAKRYWFNKVKETE